MFPLELRISQFGLKCYKTLMGSLFYCMKNKLVVMHFMCIGSRAWCMF